MATLKKGLPLTRLTVQDRIDRVLPRWDARGERVVYARLTEPDPFLERYDTGEVALVGPQGDVSLGRPCVVNYRERGKGGPELRPLWWGDRILYHRVDPGQEWDLRWLDPDTGEEASLTPERGMRCLGIWPHPKEPWMAVWIQRPGAVETRRRLWRSWQVVPWIGQIWILGPEDWMQGPGCSPEEGSFGDWNVLDLAWDPTGFRVGFLLETPSEARKMSRRLVVLDLNPPQQLEVLAEGPRVGMLTWSPKGDQVAYHEVGEDRIPRLYLRHLETGETRMLEVGPAGGAAPQWSPTGDWILFQVREMERRLLALVHPEAGGVESLTYRGWCVYPRWSPRGDRLLFLRTEPSMAPFYGWKTHLIWMSLERRKEVRVTSQEVTCGVDTCCPAWAPDGKTIVFAGRDEGGPGRRLALWKVTP